jgi:hypothetical protein
MPVHDSSPLRYLHDSLGEYCGGQADNLVESPSVIVSAFLSRLPRPCTPKLSARQCVPRWITSTKAFNPGRVTQLAVQVILLVYSLGRLITEAGLISQGGGPSSEADIVCDESKVQGIFLA